MACSSRSIFDADLGEIAARKWMAEIDDAEDSAASDCESDNSDFNSEHNTDSDIEKINDSLYDEINKKAFYWKNRYKWSAEEPCRNVRTQSHNVMTHHPGLKGPAKSLSHLCSYEQAWDCIFSKDMLDEIVKYTNEKLCSYREKHVFKERAELKDTDVVELKAFIGLLYYTAIFKSNHESLEAMFATDGTGRDVFRCTLSMKRMLVLLMCLRFDNSADRIERKESDAAAAISLLFQKMVKNSQECYSAGQFTCIDEMLVGFSGRCKFRVYMASKRKYGIKIYILCDARTNYLLNAYIYTGKNSDGLGLSADENKLLKTTQCVLRLSQPITGSNRNITAHNYFDSIELLLELKKRKLTYVGTQKKNQREIPPEFLPNEKRKIESSELNFYNTTKGGVDTLDQECTTYSTSRRTRRWSMAIFYTILNISAVNANILYISCKENSIISRFDYLKGLARELVYPYMRMRYDNPRLTRELKLSIKRILGEPLPKKLEKQKLLKRKRCEFCPRSEEKKSSQVCEFCYRSVCINCRAVVCGECV